MLIRETGKNQTIFDLAMKFYGNAEAVDELLGLNPHLLTDYSVMEESDLSYNSGARCLSLPFIVGQVLYVDDESPLFDARNSEQLSVQPVASFDPEQFIIPGTVTRDTSLDYQFIIL